MTTLERATPTSTVDCVLRLGPMLRYVDSTSATIWVETARCGVVEILGRRTPTFCVQGRHYALAIIEDLEPASVIPYDVRFDGDVVWPARDSTLPPSVIRTLGDEAVSLLVGSCRAAAPHEEPYTLELALDERGRGVDTLWAHASRMLDHPAEQWPTALLLVGDQIYADDSSPSTKDRIEQTRNPECELPPSIVLDFGEYSWLYHEAWSSTLERWLFSVVPTMMVFDDHDVIDDWNISATWVAEVHHEDWWPVHNVGSLMSYWIYQHLGNQSPEGIKTEGLLEQLCDADDATSLLEQWAGDVSADPTSYRFSYSRHLGDVTVVVIDGRHSRVLGEERRMVNESEWAWIKEQSIEPCRHLVLATTLPVFIPSGLHDLQVWNERVCDGAWSRLGVGVGERLRRALDLEDWSAFSSSYHEFVELLTEIVGSAARPETVIIASGDIHFSYVARVMTGAGGSGVFQLVSSPIRNALIPPERSVMRFTLTRAGARVGAALRRLAGRGRSAVPIEMLTGPHFANNMAVVNYRDDHVGVVIEHATPADSGGPHLSEVGDITLRRTP